MITRIIFLFLMMIAAALPAAEIDLPKAVHAVVTSGTAAAPVIAELTPPVAVFAARFAKESTTRACWDFPINRDLTACAGIRLKMRCIGAEYTNQLTIHLLLDGTWFSTVCTPRTGGLWEELFIPKSSFLPEGDAAAVSWRKCTKLRLAAWPSSQGKFQWQIAQLELAEANTPIALLRCGVNAANARSSWTYARHLGDALNAGGLRPAVIDEPDITINRLKKFRCLMLPAAENCTAETTNVLQRCVTNGAKMLCFYALPPKLAAALHFPGGRFKRASDLGLTLAAIQTPFGTKFKQNSSALMAVEPGSALKVRAWWVDAAGNRTPYPALLQSPYGMWMTHVYLNQDPEHALPLWLQLLEEYVPNTRRRAAAELKEHADFCLANAAKGRHIAARKELAAMQKFTAEDDYSGVWKAWLNFQNALADEATPSLTASANTLSASEMRGRWLRAAAGLPGMSWKETLRVLAKDNLNTIFPMVLTPAGSADEKDIAACLDAARSAGIKVHAWCQILSLADAPKTLQKSFAEAGRLQQNAAGKTVPWLCPSQPANRTLLRTLITSLLRKHAFDGLQFDMLRYSSGQECYCNTCKSAFVKYLGRHVEDWSALPREEWRSFRRRQITAILAELGAAAKQVRPSIILSAAVFPNLESAKSGVAQDWLAWVRERRVKFIAPMNYRPTAPLFQGDLLRQKELLGIEFAGALIPGIGVAPERLSPAETARQIKVVRNAALDGYILFE